MTRINIGGSFLSNGDSELTKEFKLSIYIGIALVSIVEWTECTITCPSFSFPF